MSQEFSNPNPPKSAISSFHYCDNNKSHEEQQFIHGYSRINEIGRALLEMSSERHIFFQMNTVIESIQPEAGNI